MWSATQVPHFVRIFMALVTGVPESQDPRHRARRGRRLRRQAAVHARGGDHVPGGAPARQAGRSTPRSRSESMLAGAPRPRPDPAAHAHAPSATARSPASRSSCSPTWAPTSASSTPGMPILGAFMYNAHLQVRRLPVRLHERLHEQDLDGRLPRRRPARGDVRHRADDGRARSRARHRPAGAARAELDQARGVPVHHRRGADLRLRQLRGRHGPGHGALRLRRAARASRPSGASRKDPVQLGIGISTFTEMCGLAPSRVLGALRYVAGGWETRVDPDAADRQGRGRHRHEPARPGPRDGVEPDRRRPARRAFEDVEVLHGDTRVSPEGWTPTARGRSRSAASRIVEGRRQGGREGQGRSRRTCWRRTPTTSSSPAAPSRVRGTDQGVDDPARSRSRCSPRTTCPTASSPALDAEATFDPENFSFPHGTHLCAVEVDTETGQVDDPAVRLPSTTSAGSSTRSSSRARCTAASPRASPRRSTRRRVHDEAGTLTTGDRSPTTRCPAPPTCRRSSPTAPRRRRPTNPLGVKGVGEAGTIASTPAVVNAVVDALRPWGVDDIEMPCTPNGCGGRSTGPAQRRGPAEGTPTEPGGRVATRPSADLEPERRHTAARERSGAVIPAVRLRGAGHESKRRSRAGGAGERGQGAGRRPEPAAGAAAADGRSRAAGRPGRIDGAARRPRRRRRHGDRRHDHARRRRSATPLVAPARAAAAGPRSTVADPQVRHRGTLGGSLAHADPAGDLPARRRWRWTPRS